jgi:hypothetical protein
MIVSDFLIFIFTPLCKGWGDPATAESGRVCEYYLPADKQIQPAII